MEIPAFKIVADGQDITGKINDRLERLIVHDETGSKSDTVTIEIDNREQAVFLPSTGARLDIWIGLGKVLTYKGSYQVNELEEPIEEDILTIHATAAEFKNSGIKAPRDRTFDNITYGELVEQIAQEYGLMPVIGEQLSSIKFEHIDQKAESDLNLLTRLGRQYDAIAKPVADRLLVTSKGEGKTASGQPMPLITIDDPENSAGRVTITERTNYQSVIAHWFDEQAQKKKKVQVGEGEPVFTIRRQFHDKNEAEDAAKAEKAKKHRGKKKMSLSRPLSPGLTAESRVMVKNHKDSANGLWVVESVDHVIERDQITTTSAELITPNK
ncbi:hypothetical protein CAG63_18275 [Vibrio sp. V37_P2S8PM304]|uniref:contractile injection system protein, VgrG/Pvc8 family n=1 Tax=Vibrio sp. V37_P2S8PM304 TaxID=1938688 RepID=UPI001372F8F8|nr:contractile injection system protein, VgrG/Pvc8 family [Vibrio sp. V37_P2S8PM304]NAX31994.1 hypothetical protein [Vibrio sp. V37_P2S8PM304]